MDNTIKLTDAEWKVMTELWERSPQSTMQLVAALRDKYGWSKSTALTLLRRMETKQAVSWVEGARSREYSPSVSRDELSKSETRSFLDKVYGGDAGLLVSALLGGDTLDEKTANELRELLARAKEREE